MNFIDSDHAYKTQVDREGLKRKSKWNFEKNYEVTAAYVLMYSNKKSGLCPEKMKLQKISRVL